MEVNLTTIEEIVKTYSPNADYYDMPGGKIFRLSSSHYNEEEDKTYIPVYEPAGEGGYEFSYYAVVKGDIRK